jgi:hypothetical protein
VGRSAAQRSVDTGSGDTFFIRALKQLCVGRHGVDGVGWGQMWTFLPYFPFSARSFYFPRRARTVRFLGGGGCCRGKRVKRGYRSTTIDRCLCFTVVGRELPIGQDRLGWVRMVGSGQVG